MLIVDDFTWVGIGSISRLAKSDKVIIDSTTVYRFRVGVAPTNTTEITRKYLACYKRVYHRQRYYIFAETSYLFLAKVLHRLQHRRCMRHFLICDYWMFVTKRVRGASAMKNAVSLNTGVCNIFCRWAI